MYQRGAIQSFLLSTIGSLVSLLLLLKWLQIQREWDIQHAAMGGNYLLNLWSGLLSAVDDPKFWVLVSNGIVGLNLSWAGQSLYPIGDDRRIRLSFRDIARVLLVSMGTAVLLFGMMGVHRRFEIAHTESFFSLARALEMGFCLIGVLLSSGFWVLGASYLSDLAAAWSTDSEDRAASCQALEWLISAALAGPLSCSLAYFIWSCINSVLDGRPVARTALLAGLGQAMILVGSLSGSLVLCFAWRRMRSGVVQTPRWRNGTLYFVVMFFFGIPLRLPLIRARDAESSNLRGGVLEGQAEVIQQH